MMKLFWIDRNFRPTVFAVLAACLLVPFAVSGQVEKLGPVAYKPVAGWTKTPKENVVAFSDINQSTGKFCIITLYGATPGTGAPKTDFAREWNNLVIKPFAVGANPETETETSGGWVVTAGGTAVDVQGGKALAFLTVLSGEGRTVSVLGLFNDESYLPKLVAFTTSLDIDKTAAQTPAHTTAAAPALKYDAGGHLLIPAPTRQLTLADVAGQWGESDGINVTYVDRYSGTYAGTDSLHYKSKMTFGADGAYYNDFYAIQNGKMIKDKTAGTISINGRVLSVRQRNTAKYVIRGWLELPTMTILEVCGPWYDDQEIPQAIFDNPGQGANLDKKWVRAK
jgi:hypothetical protein